jgi:hypothetical protein
VLVSVWVVGCRSWNRCADGFLLTLFSYINDMIPCSYALSSFIPRFGHFWRCLLQMRTRVLAASRGSLTVAEASFINYIGWPLQILTAYNEKFPIITPHCPFLLSWSCTLFYSVFYVSL